jgi:oligopeptide transport system substrate-binding protein
VGNGPFNLKQWDLNKVIIVEKSPTYWDADTVQLNGIYFYPTQNIMTEERMFRAGQLHKTREVPPNKIAVYQRENPEVLKISPYLGTYFYRINTRLEHLDDVRVRRALSLAINREQLVNFVTRAGEIAAYTITPPDTMGYTAEPAQPTFNPERARQLLVEAGYPNGEGLPVMELLFNTSESHRKIAVAVQQMWKKELNVTISLLNQDWKVYLDAQHTGNFQICRAAWIGDYVDANSFLDMWVKESGNNHTGWHNAEFDRLVLEVAPKATNREQRYQAFKKAESILLNDARSFPSILTSAKSSSTPA